jgi:hypothetical protein
VAAVRAFCGFVCACLSFCVCVCVAGRGIIAWMHAARTNLHGDLIPVVCSLVLVKDKDNLRFYCDGALQYTCSDKDVSSTLRWHLTPFFTLLGTADPSESPGASVSYAELRGYAMSDETVAALGAVQQPSPDPERVRESKEKATRFSDRSVMIPPRTYEDEKHQLLQEREEADGSRFVLVFFQNRQVPPHAPAQFDASTYGLLPDALDLSKASVRLPGVVSALDRLDQYRQYVWVDSLVGVVVWGRCVSCEFCVRVFVRANSAKTPEPHTDAFEFIAEFLCDDHRQRVCTTLASAPNTF